MTDIVVWLLLGAIVVVHLRQKAASGAIRKVMADLSLSNRVVSAIDGRLKDAEKRLEILEAEDYGWKSLPSLNRSQTDQADEREAEVSRDAKLNVAMRAIFEKGYKIRLCNEATWWLLEDKNDVVVLVNECFSGLCDAIVKERKLWE